MTIKSAYFFRFTKPFTEQLDVLPEVLGEHTFVPCGTSDIEKTGWVSPTNSGTELVRSVMQFTIICLQIETKQIPASAVNYELEKQVDELQSRSSRKCSRKERTEIKEEIIRKALPHALPSSKRLLAFFDGEYLVVCARSIKDVDVFTSYLRKCIGSLPIRPLETETAPAIIARQLLLGEEGSSQLEASGDTVLKNDESSTIAHRRIDEPKAQLEQHLRDEGYHASEVSLYLPDIGWFKLIVDGLHIRNLKLADTFIDRHLEDVEDESAAFDAQFLMFAAALSEIREQVVKACGGLKLEE